MKKLFLFRWIPVLIAQWLLALPTEGHTSPSLYEQNYRDRENRRERNNHPYYHGYCENGRYQVEPPVPYPGRRGEQPEGDKYPEYGCY